MLARADRLIAAMEQHEEPIAARAETELFPDGVPSPLTIADLLRAIARNLAASAEEMAQADIAHGRLEAKRRPDTRRTSYLSQDVAVRLARSAEIEGIARTHAQSVGDKSEARFFPEGHSPWHSVLDLLRAVRGAVTQRRDDVRRAPGDHALNELFVVTKGAEGQLLGLADMGGYEGRDEMARTLDLADEWNGRRAD